MNKKVAIIGAGPAGIACAFQLKRLGIDSLLFEKNQVGGLLRNANLVENYLGFDSGISGQELVKKFKKNLENLEIQPIFEEVKKVSFSNENFILEAGSEKFTSEFLVVASGTRPKKLPFEIFYEIADLPEKNYDGKKFAVIGAGDAAFDYAINLVNNYNAAEVIILNRSSSPKSLLLLIERAAATGKIKHLKNVKVDSIAKKDGKKLLSCVGTDDNFDLNADFVMAAIGREPLCEFLDENIDKTELKKQEKLYFIGDVTNGFCRQTSIAVGDGLKIAMKIYNTLI